MPLDPTALARARAGWRYRGTQRPPFALPPGPGQESVWDYPRPPAYRPDRRRVEVYAGSRRLALTEAAIRVCETGGAPAFYLPPVAVDHRLLSPSPRRTFCEWKGEADYWHVTTDDELIPNAVWRYPTPFPEAASIAGWFGCYPALLRCFVDGEAVRPQPGGYYGGWVTSDLVGPFKGAPEVPNE